MRLRRYILDDGGDGDVVRGPQHRQCLSDWIFVSKITSCGAFRYDDAVAVGEGGLGISFDKWNGKHIEKSTINPPYSPLCNFNVVVFHHAGTTPTRM